MVKPVKSTPLMISIAEKVGTAVGRIVARTTGAVEGATKMVEDATNALKPAKPTPARKVKPKAKRKAGTIKKKVVRKAAVTTRKRKRPAEE